METWRRKFFSRWGEWSLLGVIVLAGFVLRLYQLGTDSFWIDEVGIIDAARQHGLGEALAAARHHVMAMPLDYVVVWAWGKLTPLDTWLRLPAALWGALTVIPAYLLYRRLGDAPIALWGAFFLACAPFHIQYSQELHFYAALTFFYILATWLLLRAVEEAKVKHWVVALAALLVGFYFHFYVMLAFVNGMFLALLNPMPPAVYKKNRLYLARALIVALAASLVGLLAFGRVFSGDIHLLMYERSFQEIFAIALGWAPFYPARGPADYAWGGLLAGLAFVSLAYGLIRRPRSRPMILFYSALCQMTAIVILNYLKNYFLTPRQFLIFLPLIVFFSAQAMVGLVRYAARWAAARLQLAESRVNLLLQAITVVALVLLCVPALGLYYAGDKGDAAGKAQRLAQLWRPGEIILVWPDYNIDVYAYYLDQLNAGPVTEALRAIDWQEAEDWLAAPESKYLITAFPLPADRLGQIAAAGMEPLIVPGQASRYTQAVWWKPPD